MQALRAFTFWCPINVLVWLIIKVESGQRANTFPQAFRVPSFSISFPLGSFWSAVHRLFIAHLCLQSKFNPSICIAGFGLSSLSIPSHPLFTCPPRHPTLTSLVPCFKTTQTRFGSAVGMTAYSLSTLALLLYYNWMWSLLTLHRKKRNVTHFIPPTSFPSCISSSPLSHSAIALPSLARSGAFSWFLISSLKRIGTLSREQCRTEQIANSIPSHVPFPFPSSWFSRWVSVGYPTCWLCWLVSFHVPSRRHNEICIVVLSRMQCHFVLSVWVW